MDTISTKLPRTTPPNAYAMASLHALFPSLHLTLPLTPKPLQLILLLLFSFSIHISFTLTMRFAKYVPGKHLFRSRKSLSPSPSSTPTSVLPETLPDVYFDVREAFEMIDRDGDGMIKMEDLDRLTCRIGGSEEDLKSASSGCISLEEFCEIAPAFAPPACDREIREAFDFFDSDRDGRITAEELFGFFGAIGDAECTLEDCRRMIRGVDRSGDGFVCFEDFSRMMEAQQRW